MANIRYIACYAALAAAATDLIRHGCSGCPRLKALIKACDDQIRPLLPAKTGDDADEDGERSGKDEKKAAVDGDAEGDERKLNTIRRLMPIRAHEMLAYFSGDGKAFADKLQKQLTKLSEQKALAVLKAGLPQEQKARVNSLLGKYAGRAFTVAPTEANLRMSATQFRMAIAFRFGITLPDISNGRMKKCACGVDLTKDPFHWLNCAACGSLCRKGAPCGQLGRSQTP